MNTKLHETTRWRCEVGSGRKESEAYHTELRTVLGSHRKTASKLTILKEVVKLFRVEGGRVERHVIHG